MKRNLSYSLTETIVRKFLKEFKGSPKRSLRNIVDIALHFSEGRFQKDFFSAIQNMLKNNDSAYYKMIEEMVYDLDLDRLVTVGMNIGYNSCTGGAKTIRNIESREKFNVPWSVSFIINDGKSIGKYIDLINQGNDLGIHTWMIYTQKAALQIIDLAHHFPDDAFIIFTEHNEINSQLLSKAKSVKNIMLVLKYEKGIEDACCILREAGMLYSVFVIYHEKESIKDGTLLKKIENLKPVFAGFAAENENTDTDDIYGHIKKARDGQMYSTVPWDVVNDSMFIDSIISEDCCFVMFEENGTLVTYDNGYKELDGNMFEQSLKDILKFHFPK